MCLKRKMKFFNNLKDRLNYFLNYGSLHGFRYLGERCIVASKICWIIVIALSMTTMTYILKESYISYTTSVISIQLDSSYLHWNNTYPSVSICFERGFNSSTILDLFTKFWDKNPDLPRPESKIQEFKYMRTVQSWLFTSPIRELELFDEYCAITNSTCGLDIQVIIDKIIPKSCREILYNVTFLGKPYDCEEIFNLQATELGYCFVANSIYSYGLNYEKLPLKYSRTNTDRKLILNFIDLGKIGYDIFVHGPEELPYFNLDFVQIRSDYTVTMMYNTVETMNSPEIHNYPMDQRQCRFPDEKLFDNLFPYSFSACFLKIRMEIELKYCNCTIPTSPNFMRDYYCDYEGLKCLRKSPINIETKEEHYADISNCYASCFEMEINEVAIISGQSNVGQAIIDIMPPNLRYYRQAVKTKLDVIVSAGGIFGLFFGGSLLSFIEIFYIWFLRKF